MSAARPGVAVAIMLAATLALLLYQGAQDEPVASPQMTKATQPAPLVVANPGLPFVTFTNLDIPAFPHRVSSGSRPQVSFGTTISLPR